jgi:Trypsin-co-occurring domain 2
MYCMNSNVTIAEALKQLRKQLEDAQREGAGQQPQFITKSVEVELGVVFKSEVDNAVGLKAWFLDISGNSKRGDETVHKIKLVLEPSKRTLVRDRKVEHE